MGNADIKILPVSIFLATKWEAFISRGTDPRLSSDFDDVIYIIDNNIQLINEIAKADQEVKIFLKEMSKEILNHSYRNEIIESHLNPYTATERSAFVIEKLINIMKL